MISILWCFSLLQCAFVLQLAIWHMCTDTLQRSQVFAYHTNSMGSKLFGQVKILSRIDVLKLGSRIIRFIYCLISFIGCDLSCWLGFLYIVNSKSKPIFFFFSSSSWKQRTKQQRNAIDEEYISFSKLCEKYWWFFRNVRFEIDLFRFSFSIFQPFCRQWHRIDWKMMKQNSTKEWAK